MHQMDTQILNKVLPSFSLPSIVLKARGTKIPKMLYKLLFWNLCGIEKKPLNCGPLWGPLRIKKKDGHKKGLKI